MSEVAHEQMAAMPITAALPELKDEPTPETEQRWKCHTCHSFFYERYVVMVDGVKHCPKCGEVHLVKMCKLDTNRCSHDISSGIKYCPECGEAVCPVCGKNHDVITISRVTGYLSETGGWNAGKRQELKDRVRYNLSL